MKWLTFCALAGALLFAACGGDDKDDASKTCGASAPEQASGGNVKKYDGPPELTVDTTKQYFATIKTEVGDIKVELYPKEAPCHVNSFVFLARDGFYDGVGFHRVLPGFVAQAGDPTGTGSGGPGYTIPLEVNSHKHVDGALGMARSQDPNSAGSQWFLDYGPQPALDTGYTVFGQIVEGRDVLDKITPRDPSKQGQQSIVPTKITTVEIEEQ